MTFLQLATEISQPFVIDGVSPITPTSSRKNSLQESATTATAPTSVTASESISASRQPRQRHNSLSLL